MKHKDNITGLYKMYAIHTIPYKPCMNKTLHGKKNESSDTTHFLNEM